MDQRSGQGEWTVTAAQAVKQAQALLQPRSKVSCGSKNSCTDPVISHLYRRHIHLYDWLHYKAFQGWFPSDHGRLGYEDRTEKPIFLTEQSIFPNAATAKRKEKKGTNPQFFLKNCCIWNVIIQLTDFLAFLFWGVHVCKFQGRHWILIHSPQMNWTQCSVFTSSCIVSNRTKWYQIRLFP